ncbi:hypothetical protein GCM10009539_15940 [Cryptosporangium japonicum]|uniref:Uncharacterized protein n=1 Tax=Cryptosporangium japonicum TaxID=80872 RepID=A0ABP3DFF5_9ACTN
MIQAANRGPRGSTAFGDKDMGLLTSSELGSGRRSRDQNLLSVHRPASGRGTQAAVDAAEIYRAALGEQGAHAGQPSKRSGVVVLKCGTSLLVCGTTAISYL